MRGCQASGKCPQIHGLRPQYACARLIRGQTPSTKRHSNTAWFLLLPTPVIMSFMTIAPLGTVPYRVVFDIFMLLPCPRMIYSDRNRFARGIMPRA
jgi:hypothetical protein